MNINIDGKQLNLTNVTQGDLELIDSKVVNLFTNSFQISIASIKIKFIFENDDKKEHAFLEVKPNQETNTIDFNVFNMDNGLLEGYYNPFQIGVIDGKQLYLNFGAWSLNPKNNIRTVVYNLYFKKG